VRSISFSIMNLRCRSPQTNILLGRLDIKDENSRSFLTFLKTLELINQAMSIFYVRLDHNCVMV
jgi:hypothetical protein